jgi:DHA2 family lincomycin resistance protein-like MFS transporter
MGLFANLRLLPMYFQTVPALSPLATGLTMLPGGLVNGLGSPVAGKLYDRLGPRLLVPAGFGIISAGPFLMSLIGSIASFPDIILYAFTVAGIPLVLPPTQTNSLGQLPPSLCSHGTTIMNTHQQIAAGLGASRYCPGDVGRSSSRLFHRRHYSRLCIRCLVLDQAQIEDRLGRQGTSAALRRKYRRRR